MTKLKGERQRRLVFICHSLQIGGAERYLASVIRYLVERGHVEGLGGVELEVICRPQLILDVWAHEIALLGVRVHRLDLRKLGDVWRLWRIVRGASLIYLNLAVPYGKYQVMSAVFGRIGAKRMVAVHQLFIDAREAGYDGFGERVWSWIFKRYANLCDRHIVVSTYDRRRLAALGLRAERLTVIANGANLEVFRPLTRATRSKVREALVRELTSQGWIAGTQIISSVGRLVPQKGFDQLVIAAKEVVVAHPLVRFIVIGEGPERPMLERLISQHRLSENFFLMGERAPFEISACVGASEVFVLASTHEGLPFAVVEAMACARPVVANAVGGVPELITNGETGYLVPALDTTALAAAIARLLDDPGHAEAMGQRGRKKAGQAFNQGDSMRRTARLIRSVLDGDGNQAFEMA
jgi:glycosyltransferase involved in cell wall biosynthesis